MRGKTKGYIGIFDSGFGGLTTLKALTKTLPEYNYIYLGDTARVPYGSRSSETIYEFTVQAVDFLFAEGAELIVVACNTASAKALRKIQQSYLPLWYPKKRVLGVIVPAAEEAAEKTKNHRIGVMATEATVQSGTFIRELSRLNPKIKVFQEACPLLVPLVESGEYHSKAAKLILTDYIKPLLRQKIDTLILGCTHYGILEPAIKKIVGKKIAVISEGSVVARKLKEYLVRHPEIDSKLRKDKMRLFYSTDLTDGFRKLGSVFFGKPIVPIKTKLD